MITYLQTHMRRHGKILLLLVMGLTIVSLLYYGPARSSDHGGPGNYAVYGHTVPKSEFETAKDAFAFLLTLQYGRPVHRNDIDNPDGHRQILLNMALAEKARRMGIRVTDQEVAARIRAMPVFLDNGHFNEQRFNEILATELPKRRLSEQNLQDVISMQIALARLNELVSTTALVTPEEVDEYLRLLNEKVEVSIAKFDEKNFKITVPPSDEQLRAFYKEYAEQFRVPRKVKALYVAFPIKESGGAEIPEEQLRAMYERNLAQFAAQGGAVKSFDEVKSLIRKAVSQQEAMDRTGKQATDFSLKFATEGKDKPDFKSLAAEQGLAVKETDYIGTMSELKGVKAPEQFVSEVLKLSSENPVSLPIVGDDVIYVAHWLDTKESSVPDFDQLKPKIIEVWKRDAALKQARETGRNARAKFTQLLAEGKSFEQASKSLSLPWQSIAAYSLRDIQPRDPDRFYKQSAFGLRSGTVGDFQNDPQGGFFVYVKSRQPADPAKLAEQRPEIAALMDRNTQGVTLFEFRRSVIEEAGLMPLFAEAEGPSPEAME